jgi:hypothetical protein
MTRDERTSERDNSTAGRDDFFDTPGFRKRGTLVIAIVCFLTLLVIALPLVYAFTGWL